MAKKIVTFKYGKKTWIIRQILKRICMSERDMFVYVFDVCVCVFFFVVRAVDHHHHHHQQQIQPDLFIHAKCE